MGVLRDEWEKHDGAMKTLSESTAGLESTFGDLTAQLAGVITSRCPERESAYKDASRETSTRLCMTSAIRGNKRATEWAGSSSAMLRNGN